jgi:acyl-CoA oxidase
MTRPTLRWPDDSPELLPYIPLIYSAWTDSTLSLSELEEVRGYLESRAPLADAGHGRFLAGWLDPNDPPAPHEILELRRRMRWTELQIDVRSISSITDLGLALWRASGIDGPWNDTAAVASLRSLEARLGLHGPEVVRRAMGLQAQAAAARPAVTPFDAGHMNAYLDRDHLELRKRVFGLLSNPALAIPQDLPRPEYRDCVLEALRFLANEGLGGLAYPPEFGGKNDPGGAISVFETLAFGDLSVLVKFGVQFGLWGGSVQQLGTERHHRELLGRIATLELPGCYAMTETGHGSNVRDLETTATYHPDTDELVIETPHDGAAKDWIGNAALHGLMATVFARLIVDDVDHGVHAIVARIRSSDGVILPGVRIEDRGAKEGLNGIDNGRIWFSGVRVPRRNLLDRFASIDDEGQYSSPIPSSGRRFFRMLRTLVAGRVSIAAASVSAAKTGLTIAVRYASVRRQFGPADAPETPILDYPLLQRELMPRLACTYGLHFAVRRLQAAYADPTRDDDVEIEVEAAGLKAYASDHCVDTLQACREACGGQGYLGANRFGALKADTDVFTTFEGANAVLYQLVAKGLLSRFRDEWSDLSLRRVMRYVVERAETSITELNPVTTRRTDDAHLLDPEFHGGAFTYRSDRLLRSAARRIRARLEDGMDSFQAVLECQDHLVALARAHVEALILERFQDAVAGAPTPGLSESLGSLSSLFALSRIEDDMGWFLEAGYLEAAKARAVRAQVGRLCAEARDCAGLFVGAFGVPDSVLPEIGRIET